MAKKPEYVHTERTKALVILGSTGSKGFSTWTRDRRGPLPTEDPWLSPPHLAPSLGRAVSRLTQSPRPDRQGDDRHG